MSSFFTVPASQKKRKRTDSTAVPSKKRTTNSKPYAKKPPRPRRDESISGSDSEDDDGSHVASEEEDVDANASESENEEETAAERRLKLAERYLQNIREEEGGLHGFDAEEIDRELIAARLKSDVAESKGKIYLNLADELNFHSASHTFFGGVADCTTSVATCGSYAYTVSKKDLKLIKWKLQDNLTPKRHNGKKPKKPLPPPRKRPDILAAVRGDTRKAKDNTFQGHVGHILAVAASADGKYVVTGGEDRRLVIWDAETFQPLRVFTQHRDAVTALAFRRNSNMLFSASKDRTIKVWSIEPPFAYVETLFGHQESVVDLVGTGEERCISVGERDRTVRLWKVAEETQLVFRGGSGEKKSSKNLGSKYSEGSMERVAFIDEEMFITGSDNGSISLWAANKKKAVHTVSVCHGLDPLKLEDLSAEQHPDPKNYPEPQPRWITALATVPYSDVILSGSWDGHVRVWKVSADRKKIESVGVLGSTPQENGIHQTNGVQDDDSGIGMMSASTSPASISAFVRNEGPPIVRGVINDISIVERGERGKHGICVVVAVGKEHRLGRWLKVPGKNGVVVFEVPRIPKMQVNGVKHGGKADGDD